MKGFNAIALCLSSVLCTASVAGEGGDAGGGREHIKPKVDRVHHVNNHDVGAPLVDLATCFRTLALFMTQLDVLCCFHSMILSILTVPYSKGITRNQPGLRVVLWAYMASQVRANSHIAGKCETHQREFSFDFRRQVLNNAKPHSVQSSCRRDTKFIE